MDELIIFGAKYLWILSVIVIVFYFYKNRDKKRFLRFAVLSLPISLIIAKLANRIYENPRPFVVGNYEPLIPHAPDNGFPSDHTLLVGSLAALATVFNKKIGLALWLIALLVAISRVAAGVHHALDVIASLIVSGLVALVIYFWDKHKTNATNHPSAGSDN